MKNYFCGWYLKFQNEENTVALIPAYHISNGEKSCSIQVITDDGAWNVPFCMEQYRQGREGVQIADTIFTRHGVALNLHGPGLDAVGKLSFGSLTPISYDIMGPFRCIPFMECRHSVYSMKHRIDGEINLNGKKISFDGGVCYIEGDRGRSFPKNYVWSQCCFPEGSVMLSVADIPLLGTLFTGVICVIHYRGREYRLATYLGARAVRIRDGEVVIRQGRKMLTVRRLEKKGLTLAAPESGKMTRTIHETAACRAYYQFSIGGKLVFSFESKRAAFEYEYVR